MNQPARRPASGGCSGADHHRRGATSKHGRNRQKMGLTCPDLGQFGKRQAISSKLGPPPIFCEFGPSFDLVNDRQDRFGGPTGFPCSPPWRAAHRETEQNQGTRNGAGDEMRNAKKGKDQGNPPPNDFMDSGGPSGRAGAALEEGITTLAEDFGEVLAAELLPCPFCGARPKVRPTSRGARVICCIEARADNDNWPRLRTAWNKRTGVLRAWRAVGKRLAGWDGGGADHAGREPGAGN